MGAEAVAVVRGADGDGGAGEDEAGPRSSVVALGGVARDEFEGQTRDEDAPVHLPGHREFSGASACRERRRITDDNCTVVRLWQEQAWGHYRRRGTRAAPRRRAGVV